METTPESNEPVHSELEQLLREQKDLQAELEPLRTELDERLQAREWLIADIEALSGLKAQLASEHDQANQLLRDLKLQVDQTREAHLQFQKEHAALELERDRLTADLEDLRTKHPQVTAEQPEAKLASELAAPEAALPLLLDAVAPDVAKDFDSYPLESELFTDEQLEAKRVAELVKNLPGLTGALIVRNQDAVLATALPVQFYEQLKVPDRNYHQLFERLPSRVQEYHPPAARSATFQLETDCLTVTQAKHLFLIVSHEKPTLRPGIPEKLASITVELAKMYPAAESGGSGGACIHFFCTNNTPKIRNPTPANLIGSNGTFATPNHP
jgi:hypothetical protein